MNSDLNVFRNMMTRIWISIVKFTVNNNRYWNKRYWNYFELFKIPWHFWSGPSIEYVYENFTNFLLLNMHTHVDDPILSKQFLQGKCQGYRFQVYVLDCRLLPCWFELYSEKSVIMLVFMRSILETCSQIYIQKKTLLNEIHNRVPNLIFPGLFANKPWE